MNILITGINGFVGNYLIKSIKDYYKNTKEIINIFGTYREKKELPDCIKESNLFQCDITNKNLVDEIIKKTKPDFIFHLAAQSSVSISWNNPQLTFDINVNGTINILNAIKDINSKCKILLIGSSDEYGIVSDSSINEMQQLNPQNPYAISKVTQEMIGKLYVKAYDMNIIMTRSFNHIGPGQKPIFVISDWAKQIAEIEMNIKEPIIKVGNLDVIRDFTDVRDIVYAYVELINKGIKGDIYNIGNDKSYKLKDILKVLISYSKVPIKFEIDKSRFRPIENKIIKCNNNKIFTLCDWKPNINIKNTLLDVLEYWRNKYTYINYKN